MHGPERDQIAEEAQLVEHREAEGGNQSERRPLLCLRVHGAEYLPAHEGQNCRLPRGVDQEHNVADALGPRLYAQAWLLSSGLETRESVGEGRRS